MKFMISWNVPTSSYRATMEAFLESGGPTPQGLTMVGRWHVPGSRSGWVLVEGDDTSLVAQFVAGWSSIAELDVSPVIDDEEAANGIRKAFAT